MPCRAEVNDLQVDVSIELVGAAGGGETDGETDGDAEGDAGPPTWFDDGLLNRSVPPSATRAIAAIPARARA
jgi:hypothetical protein